MVLNSNDRSVIFTQFLQKKIWKFKENVKK